MGFNDKHNNAEGRHPDFGAIFMSNSPTRKECFKRRLFGFPSSEIHFVEQVKAGMILFLFDYEKRQLHGVYKASCDGGFNIVPHAFASLGKQYPAQVKFFQVWSCKPLQEKLFRDAIIENYFSASKFNFGLSEKQVHKLLYLFNMTKLEPDVPGRLLTRTEDFKSERYSLGKAGRSVDHGTHFESVHNELGWENNRSPVATHKFQGNSSKFNGEFEYVGFNASDLVDTRSGYVNDHLTPKDENAFTPPNNEDHMDFFFMPSVIAGYSKSSSDNIRVRGDSRLSINDRLVTEDMRKTDQRMLLSDDIPVLRSEDLRKTDRRMLLSDDIPVLRNSTVNSPVFYGKSILEHNSLVQNQLRQTSDMIHPIHRQILGNSYSYAIQGDASSNSTIMYEPDAPSINFSHSPSVGINLGSKSIMESASPSNNCRANSLSSHPSHMNTELKDMNRWHDTGGEFLNSSFYTSNRHYVPFNAARNSNQLAAESVVYETSDNIPSLRSSLDPIAHLDIGNSGGVHEPFSSLFCNCKSSPGDHLHSAALRENLSHEIIQQKNETVTTDDPWAIEGHPQYGDMLIHAYDTRCHDDSQNNNSGYPKKKNSVFSRLSVKKDVNRPYGNNAWNEDYDLDTSVDEVMERVRLSHSQWMPKRKLKPNKHKAESLRDKTQIISSKMKSGCTKNTLEDLSTVLTASSGGHNKAESLRDKTQITISKKSDCSKNTLEDKSTDLTTASGRRSKAESVRDRIQFLSSRMKSDCCKHTLEDISTEFTSASGGNKTAEEICFVDFKRRSKVRKLSDKIEIRDSNESQKSEDLVHVQQKRRKLIRPNFSKNTTSDDKGIDVGTSQNLQVSLSDRSYNLKNASGSCCALVQTEENIKADAEVPNIVGQTHFEDKNTDDSMESVCSKEGEKATDGVLTVLNDGSQCLENIDNQNVVSSASCRDKSCHIREGLHSIDDVKSVSLDTQSVSQEHHMDKIICAGSDINTVGKMTKDCGSPFSNEVKDISECIQNSGNNDKAPIEIKEGLHVMD